jgi:hypothetical protein
LKCPPISLDPGGSCKGCACLCDGLLIKAKKKPFGLMKEKLMVVAFVCGLAASSYHASLQAVSPFSVFVCGPLSAHPAESASSLKVERVP